MSNDEMEEVVLRMPNGEIQPFGLPSDIARKVAIYRKLKALGLDWREIVFLLKAETF